MAVPKRKTSKAKKNSRRSHHGVTVASLSVCPQCGQKKKPHTVCEECGYYKGKEVVKVEAE